MESQQLETWVGIDVAKRHWDVAVSGRPGTQRFAADTDGLTKLLLWLDDLAPRGICLEATGRCEARLVAALHAAGWPLSVVNPRQIRDFARATGQLAKTDQIDAQVIALFAARIQPAPDEPDSETQQKLASLRARRQQVVSTMTQEKNRLSSAPDAEIAGIIQQAIDFYRRQRQELDRQIADLLEADAALTEQFNLLVTVPGVGKITAMSLLADLPELGRLNRGQAAKLVGLAPLNRDSGQFRGRRMIGGGRGEVRQAIYMATITAIRINPVIHRHYRQLLDKGKAKMVALTACMRKLLLILNAMLKNHSAWSPQMKT